MPLFPFSARGGFDRGPQIGPHTFDCRTHTDGTKPAPFSAIAWSPGPGFPAVELWCFNTTATAAKYRIVNATYPHLWIDMVPDANGFVPPPNAAPESTATQNALKQYAADRLALLYAIPGQNDPQSNWDVQVMLPYPVSTTVASRKIEGAAAAPGRVYEVKQLELSDVQPVAWVWVTYAPYHEVWLMYRPLELSGMRIVGMPIDGQGPPHPVTHMQFERVDAMAAGLDIAKFAASIATLKTRILARPNCPASIPEEIVVHDYRVRY